MQNNLKKKKRKKECKSARKKKEKGYNKKIHKEITFNHKQIQ